MKKEGFGKIKTALKGKGFVVALALCVTAVGAATYAAYDSAASLTKTKEELTADDSGFSPQTQGVDAQQTGIPKETTASPQTEQTQEANNFFVASAPRVMPVKDAEIINPFSNGELVKSETLGVWQTHDGIDLSAPLGTIVQSCTKGTVSEIYEDAQWGVCVVVDHLDGNVGYYFGLDKKLEVVVGQELLCGEAIGIVGDTAQIECALPPHLHFAVKTNGSWVDPEAFVSGE